MNPYKKISVKLADGTEIKSFAYVFQACNQARYYSRVRHERADVIVNGKLFAFFFNGVEEVRY